MLSIDVGAVAIDTNVIIYAFDESAIHKRDVARRILSRSARFPLRLPLQVAGETFRVLAGKLKWEIVAARDVTNGLLFDIPTIATTLESIRSAMDLCAKHRVSFWDAAIIATAARGGCGVLLTEDYQQGRQFGTPDVARPLRIIDPFVPENLPILQAIGALPGVS